MDTLTWISSFLLVGGALVLVLYPLWRQSRQMISAADDQTGQTLEEAEVRYQVALQAIRDLMFDYELKKVSTADYEALLAKTKLEAAHIRRQIDQLNQHTEIAPNLEADIEKLIAQVRNGALHREDNLLQREIDSEIEQLKTVGLESSPTTRSCPNCDAAISTEDAFCSRCGQPLTPNINEEVELDQDVCPSCGFELQPDDAFCAQCGASVSQIPTPFQTPEKSEL